MMMDSDQKHRTDMTWWRQGRFGLFIHFGIYAASEGTWMGEEVPGLVEWMQCKKRIPISQYQELAKHLTLEKFDARAYARLAKAAGMKYVAFTAKHHDGFAMYDSRYSPYNVAAMCPPHRDIARELAEAVREAGLTMCFYYSQALDWQDQDGFGNEWDFKKEEKVYRRFLDGKCKNQLRELLTEYGEIGMIWFDMPRGMTVEESLELKAYVKQFQPDCLVSGRINMDQSIGDYGSMGDNEFPSGKLTGDWETPATLNNTWGFRKTDDNWKSPEELLRLLIELLSKGMNYLLNIGPRPDGSIPEKSVELLKEMGKWVSLNEEAVYGTEATPYQFDFPWGRVSQKGSKLFLYLLEKTDRICLPGVENQVLNIVMFTEAGKKEITWSESQSAGGRVLNLTIPDSGNPWYDVICLELRDGVKVRQGLFQLPDGKIDLFSHMVRLIDTRSVQVRDDNEGDSTEGNRDKNEGDSRNLDVEFEAEKGNILVEQKVCIDPNGNIVNWFDPHTMAQWNFHIYQPGVYEVKLQTRSAKYMPWMGGHLVSVECDHQRLTEKVEDGTRIYNSHSRYFDERLSTLGTVSFGETGGKQLTLRLLQCGKEETAGLLVTKIQLSPVCS